MKPYQIVTPEIMIDILKYMENEKIPVPDAAAEKMYEAFCELNIACFKKKVENGTERKNRKTSKS